DFLNLGRDVDFGSESQDVSGIEVIDLRADSFNNSSGPLVVSLDLADVLDFAADATTGEVFGATAIDLVIRGDADDAVNLAIGSGFALAGNQALADPIYGGAGIGYDIYTDGSGQVVAIEDIIATVNTS
ncbi:MAG: hypothetical protein AB7F08_09455, partial [Dongiaceae bacterium]